MTTSPVPSDRKTCAKCGRVGTRSFVPEGDVWVCAAQWSCQGRVAEANAAPPPETTCHKCGRVGVRGFVFDTTAQAPKCSSWGACLDRERERQAKEPAEAAERPPVPSDTDRRAAWETDPDVLTWDHREQPDFDKLGELLTRHGVTVAEIDTQSDQYALRFGTAVPGPTAAANPAALVRECARLQDRVASLQARLTTAEEQLATVNAKSESLSAKLKDFLDGQSRIAQEIGKTTDKFEQQRLLGLAEARATLRSALDGDDDFMAPTIRACTGCGKCDYCAYPARALGLGEGDSDA